MLELRVLAGAVVETLFPFEALAPQPVVLEALPLLPSVVLSLSELEDLGSRSLRGLQAVVAVNYWRPQFLLVSSSLLASCPAFFRVPFFTLAAPGLGGGGG